MIINSNTAISISPIENVCVMTPPPSAMFVV